MVLSHVLLKRNSKQKKRAISDLEVALLMTNLITTLVNLDESID